MAGDRVRIHVAPAASEVVDGRVHEIGRDTVWLRPAETGARGTDIEVVAGEVVERLERSLGPRSRPAVGTAAGALVGAIVGTVWWNAGKEPDDDATVNGYMLAAGAAAGGLAGLAVGALVRSEDWHAVPRAWFRSRTLVIGVSVTPASGSGTSNPSGPLPSTAARRRRRGRTAGRSSRGRAQSPLQRSQ